MLVGKPDLEGTALPTFDGANLLLTDSLKSLGNEVSTATKSVSRYIFFMAVNASHSRSNHNDQYYSDF